MVACGRGNKEITTMPSVNKVILIGNLTRDPQSRQLPTRSTRSTSSGQAGSGQARSTSSGQAQNLVADFGLAMNRKFKTQDGEDREDVCFVDCTAFGRQAEVIAKYCKKGKRLYIEGRLRHDTWDDKNGGGKRSKLSVVVENFQFLGSREDQPAGDASGSWPSREGRGNWDGANLPERPAKRKPEQPFGDQLEFKEADIPF
jgi:single-strand DNA-binding protein